MKPVVTWVVLANARTATVYAHLGPGNGLTALSGATWKAEKATAPRDRAGIGHSIAGPGIAAVGQTDPQDTSDMRFARAVAGHLSKACLAKRFDRLIVVAGPHMLGLLRMCFDAPLRAVLLGEIPKDLSHQHLGDVERQLGELIAV